MSRGVESDLVLDDGTDIRRLPKVLLHDHLDGGLRPATIIELAAEAGVELPASTPESLADWFVTAADSGSLETYLKTFAITVAVMQTSDNLCRIAREAVIDLAADGVVYAELRWAPEQHLEQGLDLDRAVLAVTEGIAQGMAEAAQDGHEIRVQQLLCAMRHTDRATEIAELAVRHRSSTPGSVCGFDIAGPEAGFPPSNHSAAFDYCCHNWMPTTCHAGEAAGLDAIESALIDARTLRLGHGTSLSDDITIEGTDEHGTYASLGPLAQWVRDRRITIESCPSSNLQTGTPSLAEHPFDVFYQLDFAVTVNTDNRLMSATSVSREIALLAAEFDYGINDIELLQLTAAEAAFLPVAERELLAEAISHRFSEIDAENVQLPTSEGSNE